jgi:hypothetical protein
MDDLYQRDCNNNDAYPNSEDSIFDTGCTNPSAKDDGMANVDDFNHQATVSEGFGIFHTSTPTRDGCMPPSTRFLVVGQIELPRGTGPLIWNYC